MVLSSDARARVRPLIGPKIVAPVNLILQINASHQATQHLSRESVHKLIVMPMMIRLARLHALLDLTMQLHSVLEILKQITLL